MWKLICLYRFRHNELVQNGIEGHDGKRPEKYLLEKLAEKEITKDKIMNFIRILENFDVSKPSPKANKFDQNETNEFL